MEIYERAPSHDTKLHIYNSLKYSYIPKDSILPQFVIITYKSLFHNRLLTFL